MDDRRSGEDRRINGSPVSDGDWVEIARLARENKALRAALQSIMQILGPDAPSSAECCPGCTAEIGMALDVLRTAGVSYRRRKVD